MKLLTREKFLSTGKGGRTLLRRSWQPSGSSFWWAFMSSPQKNHQYLDFSIFFLRLAPPLSLSGKCLCCVKPPAELCACESVCVFLMDLGSKYPSFSGALLQASFQKKSSCFLCFPSFTALHKLLFPVCHLQLLVNRRSKENIVMLLWG